VWINSGCLIVVYSNKWENKQQFNPTTTVYSCELYNGFSKIVVYYHMLKYKWWFYLRTVIYTSFFYPKTKQSMPLMFSFSFFWYFIFFVTSSSSSLHYIVVFFLFLSLQEKVDLAEKKKSEGGMWTLNSVK